MKMKQKWENKLGWIIKLLALACTYSILSWRKNKTVLLYEYSHEYVFVQLWNRINSTSMNKFLYLGRRVEDPASNKHIMVIIRHMKYTFLHQFRAHTYCRVQQMNSAVINQGSFINRSSLKILLLPKNMTNISLYTANITQNYSKDSWVAFFLIVTNCFTEAVFWILSFFLNIRFVKSIKKKLNTDLCLRTETLE